MYSRQSEFSTSLIDSSQARLSLLLQQINSTLQQHQFQIFNCRCHHFHLYQDRGWTLSNQQRIITFQSNSLKVCAVIGEKGVLALDFCILDNQPTKNYRKKLLKFFVQFSGPSLRICPLDLIAQTRQGPWQIDIGTTSSIFSQETTRQQAKVLDLCKDCVFLPSGNSTLVKFQPGYNQIQAESLKGIMLSLFAKGLQKLDLSNIVIRELQNKRLERKDDRQQQGHQHPQNMDKQYADNAGISAKVRE